MKGLYIHIPFCDTICTYCDFAKEVATTSKKAAYVEQLINELSYYKETISDITTLYIGGGTPSVLSHALLEDIINHLNTMVQIETLQETTIELNPNDVDEALAKLLYRLGFRRISLGVQTFSEKQLVFLNRKHREKDIIKAVQHLRDAGFDNISIDMMFGLVNQSLQAIDQDIEKVLALRVEHISYYSLILEEKTPLYYLVEQNRVKLPDEDLEGAMFERVIERLTNFGYEHYEISNFATENHRSKHNMVYWKNAEYIGIGAGSHGLLDGKRYYNERSVKKYIEAVKKQGYSKRESYLYEPLRDHMLMGLRMLEGVALETIKAVHNVDLFELYPSLNEYIEKDLLEVVDGHLRLTKKGLMIGNDIFAIF